MVWEPMDNYGNDIPLGDPNPQHFIVEIPRGM